MIYRFPRTLLSVLLSAWSCLALAAGTTDPFGTDALAPPKPALRQTDAATVDPCAAQQPAGPLNLLQVVDLALCNNPQTREVWANTRAQAAQVGVAKAAYLPSLNATAAASRNSTSISSGYNQRSAGLTLSYLLYDFGAREANLENERQLLVAVGATQDSTVQSVFLAAIQSFYQVQATQAALDAARESERAGQESYAAADARYSVGAATPADKLQAQTAYSQASLNRIRAEGDLKNAQGALANVIGRDATRPVSLVAAVQAVPVPGFERDVDALVEEARRRRPDLLAAAAQVRAAEANADAARAAGRPAVSLAASTNYQGAGDVVSHSSSVGVNLSMPLFSGYAPTYRVRAAEAQAEAKSAQLERLRLQVALDVWTAYQNLTTATQSLRSSADLLSSAEQAQRVVLGRYKAGVGSILDVLNAQSALASARQQSVQAAFNWNTSRAVLAQTMGSLDYDLLQTLPDAGGAVPRPEKNRP